MNNLNSNFNHFNLNTGDSLTGYDRRSDLSRPPNALPSTDGLLNSSSQILLDVNAVLDRLRFLASFTNKNSINQPTSARKPAGSQLMIACHGQITNHLEQSTELRIVDNGDQLITGKCVFQRLQEPFALFDL